ncbi:short-chain dehydrogenase, putative [Ixodes scapularis]|uniref:Short-chain dehydrogenase, putative n=1 Tax=Ixodes scapularis TaxID=6945 RepID=B7QNU1_IXOSC|nr:short-chain dehydrogenase, putative [Ixodes scapularis]|eukprot:XP_002416596.1 short-chain dehydrogenase, putative [Ixodes scapularis]
MGENHLGHFLLTNLLLERLKNSQPSRVVVVTSSLYKRGKLSVPDMVMDEGNYDKKLAYANSKLANVLFVRELSRRLKGTGVRAYAASPGMVYTNLGRHVKLPWYLVVLLLPFALFAVRTPSQGCQTIVDCAVNEEYDQHSGKLYRNCQPDKLDSVAMDDEFAFKVKACILADERLLFLKELVLAVPDVQGDEEAYEGPSLVGRPKLVGVRKRSKNGNSDAAGPSHSMAEETDSAEDEEDGYLDDETDDASSENATDVAPAMPAYKNPAAMVAYPHITPFAPVAPNVLQPSLLQKHNIAPSLIGAASKGDEDDYDS